MINLPNIFGHLNNKKGLTASYNSTFGTVVYAVSTNTVSSGSQLVIKTYTGSTGELSAGKILNLLIPYRVFINDYKFFNNILTPGINKTTLGSDAFKLFNPGISSVGSLYELGGGGQTLFQNGTTKMIQLNLTRDMLENFNGKTYNAYKSNTDYYSLEVSPNTVKAYDLEASIIVKQFLSPELYDWLYVTVCSRVDIDCKYNNQFDPHVKNDYWYYSLPVTLCYKITKSDIKGTGALSIVPFSWTYPLNDSWHSKDNFPIEISKINNITSDYYSNYLWNYNLIPSRIRSDKRYTPESFGCLADMTYDEVFNWLYVYSVVGNFNKGRQNLISRTIQATTPFKQYNTISKIEMNASVSGFINPITSNSIDFDLNELCGQVTIESLSGSYLAVSQDTYNGINNSNYTTLSFYDESNFKNISQLRFNDVYRSDLTLQNKVLYYKFNTYNQKVKVIQFPEINLTFLNSIKHGLTIPDVVQGLLIEAGGVLKADYNSYLFSRKYKDYYFSDYPNVIFKVDSLDQDKTFMKDIYEYINSTSLYLQFTSDESMMFSLINNSPYQGVSYQTKYVDSNPYTNPGSWIQNLMFVTSEDGFDSNDYCIIEVDSQMSNQKVSMYKPTKVTLGSAGSAVPYYWADPTLGVNYLDSKENQINDNQKHSISLIIDIENNSGIYSKKTIDTDAFDASLTPNINPNSPGGVEIDTTLTPNTNFSYDGDYKLFIELLNTSNGGYRAICDWTMEVTLTDSSLNNLLYNQVDKQIIIPSFWKYDRTGTFNILTLLNLDLTNTNSVVSYTDPNFSLSNCNFGVTLKDKYGKIIDSRTYLITIDPPNGSGIMYSQDLRTKTITDFHFYLERDWIKGSPNYTEVLNVIKNIKNSNKELEPSNSLNFKGTPPENEQTMVIFPINIDNISRGGYIYYQYEPKLNGTKPIINEVIAYTPYVTNCRGHKYSISNVSIQFGFSDIYQSDVIEKITQGEYLYIDTVNDSCQVKVTLDINHENWSDNERDKNNENTIYPLISGIYLVAINEVADKYSHLNIKNISEYTFPKLITDTTSTYPNVNIDNGFSSVIKNLTETVNIYPTGIYFTPTNSKLTSQDIVVEIKKSGKYRLYLEVEDEFRQFSTWCITNKKNNFNYPLKDF